MAKLMHLPWLDISRYRPTACPPWLPPTSRTPIRRSVFHPVTPVDDSIRPRRPPHPNPTARVNSDGPALKLPRSKIAVPLAEIASVPAAGKPLLTATAIVRRRSVLVASHSQMVNLFVTIMITILLTLNSPMIDCPILWPRFSRPTGVGSLILPPNSPVRHHPQAHRAEP